DAVRVPGGAPGGRVGTQLAPGVEPGRWNGRTHAGLVALEMRDVGVRGWRVPGFAGHLQVNFRLYAGYGGQPAVTFVRELVPSRLIAAVGRLRYGEPVQAARISARVIGATDRVSAEYPFGLDE